MLIQGFQCDAEKVYLTSYMSSVYDENEEEPQTTESNVKKPPPNTVVLMPRRMPQSLHEARVIANSVRVAPGRYRVMSPPLTLSQNQASSSSRIEAPSISLSTQAMDARPRRPTKAVGDGQQLGKPFFPATQFSKIVELLPNRQKRRVYFPDDEDVCDEHSPKKLRVVKRVDLGRYKKFEDTNAPECSAKEDHQSHSHVLPRTEDGELGKPSLLEEHGDYVEEVVDVMDEDCSVTGSMIPTMEVMRNLRSEHGLPRLGQLNLVRQLKGENNYLKEQLDASFYRIKQLEALLLDRNQRLKQLLAENVQMSVRMRRLTNELGEDAARELLNPPTTDVITR